MTAKQPYHFKKLQQFSPDSIRTEEYNKILHIKSITTS